MTCVDCVFLDLRTTEKMSREARHDYVKLGMYKCKGLSHGRATFITSWKARNCHAFEKASDEQIERRITWMNAK